MYPRWFCGSNHLCAALKSRCCDCLLSLAVNTRQVHCASMFGVVDALHSAAALPGVLTSYLRDSMAGKLKLGSVFTRSVLN